METWKERLVEEQKDVKGKLVKLVEFMNSEKFFELSANYKQVLNNQKLGMEIYLQSLNTRLFEDIELATIPNFGAITALGNMFNGMHYNPVQSK